MHFFLVLVMLKSRGQTKMMDRRRIIRSVTNPSKKWLNRHRRMVMDCLQSMLSRRAEKGGKSLRESNSRLKVLRTFHEPFDAQIIVSPCYELQFFALLRKKLREEVTCKFPVNLDICVTHTTHPIMFV